MKTTPMNLAKLVKKLNNQQEPSGWGFCPLEKAFETSNRKPFRESDQEEVTRLKRKYGDGYALANLKLYDDRKAIAQNIKECFGEDFPIALVDGLIVFPQNCLGRLEDAGVKINGSLRKTYAASQSHAGRTKSGEKTISKEAAAAIRAVVLGTLDDSGDREHQIVGKILDDVFLTPNPSAALATYEGSIRYGHDSDLRHMDGSKVFDTGTFWHGEESRDFELCETISEALLNAKKGVDAALVQMSSKKQLVQK
jgi:hypothetical protein